MQILQLSPQNDIRYSLGAEEEKWSAREASILVRFQPARVERPHMITRSRFSQPIHFHVILSPKDRFERPSESS